MLFEQQLQEGLLFSNYSQHSEQHQQYQKILTENLEHRIANPLINSAISMSTVMTMNIPADIKLQLAGLQYLSYDAINKIGKQNQSSSKFPSKRKSGFDKRLMAMKKAIQNQQMRIQNIHLQNLSQSCFDHGYCENQINLKSMMQEQRHNINMQYVLNDNLQMDCEHEMCHQQESYETQDSNEDNDIYENINYSEYESYLNV